MVVEGNPKQRQSPEVGRHLWGRYGSSTHSLVAPCGNRPLEIKKDKTAEQCSAVLQCDPLDQEGSTIRPFP
jgi:hypothetical protein